MTAALAALLAVLGYQLLLALLVVLAARARLLTLTVRGRPLPKPPKGDQS